MGRTTRQIVDDLPTRLGVHATHGDLRVKIRFRNGRYRAPIRCEQFRIPADKVEEVDCAPPGDSIGVDVEQLAQQMGCVEGDAEIVLEYEQRAGHIVFRRFDVVWEL